MLASVNYVAIEEIHVRSGGETVHFPDREEVGELAMKVAAY